MSTEKLIVKLEAQTADLDNALDKTDSKLDSLDGKTNTASKSLSDFTGVAKKGAGLLTLAAGAIAAMTTEAVIYGKELQIAARRNKESVEEMQALAFAANTVGVSLEKLGDIGKDTREKIAEFLATGGGGFSDFKDVMQLTEGEAKDLAKEFENMSGTDVLQAMVTQMEDAGVSASQMSFALEGMASDTTDLIPILQDGGKAVNGLKGEFKELGATLSQEDLNKISAVGAEFEKMKSTLSAETRQSIADYSKEISKAIKVTTELITATKDTFGVIATGWGNILEISKAAVNDFVNGTSTVADVIGNRAKLSQDAIDKLKGSAEDVVDVLGSDFAPSSNGGVIIPENENSDSDGTTNNEKSPEEKRNALAVESITNRFLTEEQLRADAYEKEREFIEKTIADEEEKNTILKQLSEEFHNDISDIQQEALDKQVAAKEKADRAKEKADKKIKRDEEKALDIELAEAKKKAKQEEDLIKGGLALAAIAFKDNKEISAAIAFINTAEGVTKALSKNDFPSAALIAATGAVQIQAILGAEKGGGSSASVPSAPPPAQPDFQQDSTGLEFTDSTESGTATSTITFNTDTGEELIDAIAGALNKGQREGRF